MMLSNGLAEKEDSYRLFENRRIAFYSMYFLLVSVGCTLSFSPAPYKDAGKAEQDYSKNSMHSVPRFKIASLVYLSCDLCLLVRPGASMAISCQQRFYSLADKLCEPICGIRTNFYKVDPDSLLNANSKLI